MKITRKDFLRKSLHGAVIISLPTILSPIIGCNEETTGPENSNPLPSIAGTLSNGKVSIPIDSTSPLSTLAAQQL